jgi:hypothetical protein
MGMNAQAVFGDNVEEMSLEEKLAAIERAMKNAQEQANEEAAKSGTVAAPVDPADLTMCEGCQ